MDSVADELTKLKSLMDAGVLTEVEFNQQKSALLAGNAPKPATLPKIRKPFDFDKLAKRVMRVSGIVGGLCLIVPIVIPIMVLSYVAAPFLAVFFVTAFFVGRKEQSQSTRKANAFVEAGLSLLAVWAAVYIFRNLVYEFGPEMSGKPRLFFLAYLAPAIVVALFVLIERLATYQRYVVVILTSLVYSIAVEVFMNTAFEYLIYGESQIPDWPKLIWDVTFAFVCLMAVRYYYAIHMQRSQKPATETAGNDALSPLA